MASNNIKLTKEQEDLIITIWNSPGDPASITTLVEKVLDKKGKDGRDPEGIAIRNFLSERGLRKMGKPEKKGLVVLTDEQKEHIRNNISFHSSVEIARTLFRDEKITPLSQEARTVVAYIKEIGPDKTFEKEKVLEDFKPPRNIDKLIQVINSVVLEAYNPAKYNTNEKRCLEANINYLSNKRFLTDYHTYDDQIERDMYLSNFVRHTYDKFDLNQQDLDIFCLLSQEIINHKQLKEHLRSLKKMQEEKIGVEDPKLSMALVESISQLHKDIDKSVSRQSSLLNENSEKRSARIKKEKESNSSFLNIFQLWKEEETRNKVIAVADEKEKEVKKVIKELSEMDQLGAAIWGMSEDDFING